MNAVPRLSVLACGLALLLSVGMAHAAEYKNDLGMTQEEIDAVLLEIEQKHGLRPQNQYGDYKGLEHHGFGFAPQGITDAVLADIVRLKFTRVMDLSQSSVTAEGFAAVASLPELTEIMLPPHLGDEAFAVLARCPKLTLIDATNCPVTDAGLALVAPIDSIDTLILRRTKVTDAGIAAFAEPQGEQRKVVNGLNHLDLAGTAITDAAMVHIAALNPRSLILRRCAISDEGLVHVKDIKAGWGMATLDVGYCAGPITDSGIAEIAPVARGLQTLYLDGSQVTDATLKTLGACGKMRYLSLAGTRVTPGCFPELLENFPELRTIDVTGSGIDFEQAQQLQRKYFAPVDTIDLKTAGGNIKHKEVPLVTP